MDINPVQVWSVVTGELTGHGTVERSGSSVRLHKEGPLHRSLLATEASDVGVTLRGVRTKQS